MRKIKKLNVFDKKSAMEMISFLNNSENDAYINKVMFNPVIYFHHLLPLRLKYLPESFVLKENNELKGLITVSPIKTREKKVEIKKLFFEENSYGDAAELVQYAVARYKAMGAVSVIVKLDNYLPELLSMFVTKCNFTQISYEKLWQVGEIADEGYDKKIFRNFHNQDSQIVANIYNESLLPHFRPLLSTDGSEFKESLFKGLNYFSEYKYTVEDKKSKNIIGYISIVTTDNKNYIVDIIKNSWIDLDINSVLNFAANKIKQRTKDFGLFVRSKRYLNTGEAYENIFINNGYKCVQNQILLTNSTMKVLKSTEKSRKFTVLSDFCPSNAMPT